MSKKKTTTSDKLQIMTYRDREVPIKRPREEWPDPDQPRYAEVNRSDALYQARVSQETADRVKAFIKTSGMQKREFTERALNSLLDALEPEYPPDKRPKK